MTEIFFYLKNGCEALIGTRSSRVGVLTLIGGSPNAEALFRYGEYKNRIPTTLTGDQISHMNPIEKEDAWKSAPDIAT